MSIRARRSAVTRAANKVSVLFAAASTLAISIPSGGQTVVLNDASLSLNSIDQLGDATLAVDNGTLSLGTSTFAKPPFTGPYFRSPVVTSAEGLFLGDGRSFTLLGDISGGGAISVMPSTLSIGTWTVAGNNAGFSGAINVFAAPGATQATLNMLAFTSPAAVGGATGINLNGVGAAAGFVGTSAGYTINQPMTTTGGSIGVFDAGSRAEVTYAGSIGGTGALTRVGEGVLTLGGLNTFQGGLTIAGNGLTVVGNDTNLGAGGTTITLQSGALMLDTGFVASSIRPLRFGNGDATLYVNSDVTWAGTVTNTGIVPGSITKAGTGNLTVTNFNNTFGSLTISGGSVTAGGTTGRLIATGSIEVNQGAALVIDNSANVIPRISNTAGVQLSGATLRLVGHATINSSAATNGVLQLGSPLNNSGQGINVLKLEPAPGSHVLARFGSIGRSNNNGAQILFRGNGLGEGALLTPVAGKSNVQFNTAPQQTRGILPYAIVDNVGGAGLDLATYNATNGVVAATYQANTINTGTTTFNVSVGADATVAGGATINSAKFTGGAINLAAGTLVVTSGAMLFTGATTFTGGTLTVGVGSNNTVEAPTANLFVHADTTINSRLFVFNNNGAGNPSGIAKSGPGVLTLGGVGNNYAGPTRILEGTVRLGATNVIPDGSSVIINPGATFDLNGFNEVIGAIGQASPIFDAGNDTYGTVNIGPNQLSIGGDGGVSTAFAHNITGTGTLLKNGAGTMTVAGRQDFTGTLSISNGTVALASHRNLGTGFSNVNRISLGNIGVNAHTALRIEDGATAYDRPIFVAAPANRTAILSFGDGVGTNIASPINLTNAQGLIVDAAGGLTLSGLISGTGPLTLETSGIGQHDSRHYSIRMPGPNTYTGVTTIAADAVVWSNPQAFGNVAVTPILLGSAEGDDNPELSGDVGGVAFTRPITVQGSLNGSVTHAMLGSRVADGGGTLAYSGNINIAGNRRLVLFSNGEPLVVAGTISGAAGASLQAGTRFNDDDVTTRSQVFLSTANTLDGNLTAEAGQLITGAAQRFGGAALVKGGATVVLRGANSVLVSRSLDVDGVNAGVLNVGARGAIVDYHDVDDLTPLDSLTALIASGYNNGAWDGGGINSSAAAAQTTTGIGIVESADIAAGSFLGQSFTGNAVLMRHTLYGDTNLDATVNINDFSRLASNFNLSGRWFTGDFNFDGTTNINDFALLAINFNQTVPAPAAGHIAIAGIAGAPVPEPGSLTLLAMIAASLSLTRRQQRRSFTQIGVNP